jgi:NADPH2:quinone reductase
MDHVLMRLNLNARIFLCGMVCQYNAGSDRSTWRGLVNIDQIHMQRATMRGFIVTDHIDRWPEAIEHLAGLLAAGRLQPHETAVHGLHNVPAALDRLFAGATTGKLVVHLADPART